MVRKTADAPETRPGARGRRSTRGNGRQVFVAGLLRSRRDNPGGDPSTLGAKRPPPSRDGARWGAAFRRFSFGASSCVILGLFDMGAVGGEIRRVVLSHT